MMSVNDNSRSFFKSINVSNCETTKTTSVNENARENIGSFSNNYFSLSNLSSIHPTDSAGPKPLRQNNFLLNASTSKRSDDDSYHSFQRHLTGPLANSSPLFQACNAQDKRFDGYLAERNTNRTHPVYEPSCLSHKPNNNSGLITTGYRERKRAFSALNTSRPLSGTFYCDATDILNPKQSSQSSRCSQNASEGTRNDAADSLRSYGISRDSSVRYENKNFELLNDGRRVSSSSFNACSASTANESAEGETTCFSDDLPTARDWNPNENREKFDEFHLDENDLPELHQMELEWKTFTANLKPSLDRLQRDTLRLVNKLKRAPDERLSKSSKIRINEIITDGLDALKINRRDESAASDSSFGLGGLATTTTTTTEDLVTDSESEAVNALSDKWDFIDKYLMPNYYGALRAQKEDEKRDVVGPDASLGDSVDGAADDGVDSDSFDRSRAPVESITKPPSTSSDIDFCGQSYRGDVVANCSLTLASDGATEDVLEIPKNDLDVSVDDWPCENAGENPTPNAGDSGSSAAGGGVSEPQTEEKRYRLRRRPKATEHYFAPYPGRRAPVRKKSTKNDNVFVVCGGKRRNRKIVRYKFHSETKAADPREFVRKMCPEIGDDGCDFCSKGAVAGVLDVSCLKPRKVAKPCPCGIFPSQVPASWSDALHASLHRNLHKLRFSVPTAVRAVANVNDGGFLYDVMQIDASCKDRNLRATLKNIKDFINMEVDFPRGRNYSLNRSVFLAAIGARVIGYLEVEPLKKAGVFLNDQFSGNVIDVKFGVTKLWVMVKYRKSGVATRLLNHFSGKKNLKASDVAFAHHGNHGMSFIQKYFGSNSALFY